MPRQVMNRRTFIRIGLLGGIGAGLVYLEHTTADIGLLNFLRWSARGGLQRIKPPAIVGLEACPSYSLDLVSKLQKIWFISEMPDVKGKSILVKPNLLDQVEGSLATTSPRLVGAILDMLIDLGAARVIVGDGSAFRRDTFSVAKSCGLSQELEARGVLFVDLNYDELVPVKARDGWIQKTDKLWLPRCVMEADYILSVPKIKTHHWAGVTLSMKNLLGTIPGSRYGWPKNLIHMNGINATILGLFKTLPPVLAIIDGVIGMEGNGPLFGTPIQHGLLVAGKDALAVDIICTQLMGFSIDSIPHLAGAAFAGLGQSKRIETRGDPPEMFQRHYEPPPVM